MCDVFLTVGSTTHAAHRLILCASSDVFQVILFVTRIEIFLEKLYEEVVSIYYYY